jgi:hypothetical protein
LIAAFTSASAPHYLERGIAEVREQFECAQYFEQQNRPD